MAAMDASTVEALPSAPHTLAVRSAQRGPEALLAAFDCLVDATALDELVERAAAELLKLFAASASLVYLEAPDLDPVVAAAGGLDRAPGGVRTVLLRHAAAKQTAVPFSLIEKGSLLTSFVSGTLRGSIFLDHGRIPFVAATGNLLAAFARHLGALAASMSLVERLRQAQAVEAALLAAAPEAVLVAENGRISRLNRTAAQLLGLDADAAAGAWIETAWPELGARLTAEQFDEAKLRAGARTMLVKLRRIREGRRALVSFSEVKSAEVPARRAAAQGASPAFDAMVGQSAGLSRVREMCRLAAQSTSSLLIEGESGVGKEVLAQAVHGAGSRSTAPFVAVHCAAIPRELLESEMFGYERGAFTGANPHGNPGKFELADGGTLLLDDVVELPLEMQAKLLRALQERSITPLGGRRARRVDVRIVATTNIPLRQAVESGRFRADLFYRLNVLHIAVPPLRDRREDIGPLAEHFLRKYSALHDRQLTNVGPQALASLQAYSWPGNVRELEHWIESEIHFAPPRATCLERLTREPERVERTREHPAAGVRPISEVEREVYAGALSSCGGDVTRAARELGVSRGKLYRKLRLYALLPR
ncbi:MAG TPA: sigma 54-interacting transcriptional regulator [Myxococcales bacterium]|nr:sigma 54-interacting transcriptional regulator [Myxococcales bacterium]